MYFIKREKVKNAFISSAKRCTCTKTRRQNHKVTDSPFRNLETTQLGASQGAFPIKTGLNPDLERVENRQEKEKS